MTFRAPHSLIPDRFTPRPFDRGLATRVTVTLVVLFIMALALPVAAQDPTITRQPTSLIVMQDENWGMGVEATGTAPLRYQWFRNGNTIAGQTNATIAYPDAQNFDVATYTVEVSNSVGSVVSEPATLEISSTPPRSIRNGTITGGANATVPILFAANGREDSVSFSLRYDTNILTSPVWTNRIAGALFSLDSSQTANGVVGLTVSVPGQFAPTNNYLGDFTFSFGATNDPLLAGLVFTNAPTPIQATSTNMAVMQLAAFAAPDFVPVDATPVLNLQSGLMEQRVRVRYTGGTAVENVRLFVDELGTDSLTNQVELYNAAGTAQIDVSGYGDLRELPYVNAGPFATGTEKTLTLEYYVTDRTTVPSPTYHLRTGSGSGQIVIPVAASPLNITIQTFVNGSYVIQFPTEDDYIYYVEYADTLTDLMNNGPTARAANPPVPGTGYSVQWIDNGPPKTESPPTDGQRFYRVLELPAE